MHLFALDTRMGHVQHQYVTNLNLVWDRQANGSLDDILKQIGQQYPALFAGIQITNIEVKTNEKGLPIGIVESEWKTKNISNQEFVLYQKQVLARLNSGSLVITLSTVQELKDLVGPDIVSISETISRLAP
jgi:hypothetical protein